MKKKILNIILIAHSIFFLGMSFSVPLQVYAAKISLKDRLIPCTGVLSKSVQRDVDRAVTRDTQDYYSIGGSPIVDFVLSAHIQPPSGHPTESGRNLPGTFTYIGPPIKRGETVVLETGTTLSAETGKPVSFHKAEEQGAIRDRTVLNSGEGYEKECDFGSFVQLINNLINFAFVAAIPISMIAFVWVGILFVTSQGNAGKIEQAKGIAWKVGIGFLFILGAWLIVNSITSVLLKDGFNIFLK